MDLVPRCEPQLMVVVVFLGNDLIELDNPTEPHLDDELALRPGREVDHRPANKRRKQLALVDPYGQLFWQGLNQALYVHRNPEREAALLQKAGHAIATMRTLAEEHRSELLWVLLPSFDLVFPEHTAGFSKVAKELVDAGVSRRLRDGFVSLLEQARQAVVDLEPDFRADGKVDLYAVDFHVYRRAHVLMAERLAGEIASRL